MEQTDGSTAFEPSRTGLTSTAPDLFDGQAGSFDRRAGLPDSCCREIAKKVIEIGEARPDDLVVEVGCGTGQIGQWFQAPIRFLGFDLSARMLQESRQRSTDSTGRWSLVQADANADWPIAGGVARVIFSSRAVHLLAHERVASEVFRIVSPAGGTLILGRVERAPDSIKERMAREMNVRLRSRGFEGRRGERRNRKLVDLCIQNGAEIPEPVVVAKWRISASPQQSLDSWRGLQGLGGIPVPAETRQKVLRELEVWAKETFGELGTEFESEDTYVLKAIRLPAARGAGHDTTRS